MSVKLKLIAENPNPEMFEGFEVSYVEEQRNLSEASTPSLYISGPMIGCNSVNRNNRMYDLDDTKSEVNRYINEMVTPKRAMGELNHPQSAEVDLERACHIVTDLKLEGDTYMGRSKVLSTPTGLVLKSLIEDGVQIGMSTRALGSLEESGSGHNIVRNMRLVAIDAVADPSFPKAFVNGILESKSYVLDLNGGFESIYEDFEKKISKLPTKNVESYLRNEIIKFIAAIK